MKMDQSLPSPTTTGFDAFVALLASEGVEYLFGYLGGAALPYEENIAGASYILAFRAMPLLLLTSVISSLLVYWRILPLLMRAFSFVLEKSHRKRGDGADGCHCR